MILDLDELGAGEARHKVTQALSRFTIEEVRGEEAFDEGYRTLDAEFGPRGELERREVLATWAAGPRVPPAGWGESITCHYHMLLARDEAGQIAGARDCFVTLEAGPAGSRAIVLLSHAVVLPAYRRSGLAALLRSAPAVLARRAAPEVREVLLVAEMDPVAPENRDTVVRLIAYGRGGFRALPPAIFPYAQPDFRDLEALGVPAQPVPMPLLIRQVHKEAQATIPRALVEACLRHVHAVHACDNRLSDIAAIRDHALAALAAFPDDAVPLLPLPADPSQIELLAPLLRGAVLPLYPPAWWGPDPPGDPALEREALIAAWSKT